MVLDVLFKLSNYYYLKNNPIKLFPTVYYHNKYNNQLLMDLSNETYEKIEIRSAIDIEYVFYGFLHINK